MIDKLKMSTSAAALSLLLAGGASSVQAADLVEEPGCTLSGSVTAGYMFDWQESEFENGGSEFSGKDVDWNTPFGEGAGLVTCGAFNAQADFAYYDHAAELDDGGDEIDLDATNQHLGGALFWRDPSVGAVGLQGSWGSQDIEAKDIEFFRVGVFGEFYFNEMFTLGASAAYFNTENLDSFGGKDQDGFELAAFGRFYATPDFSLMVRGDVLFSDIEFSGENGDLNGFAITGEAEYLVWDQGLSIFAGARYAERTAEPDDVDFEAEVDDMQVFAGIKFYFGNQGTLVERQRTGTVDNTSVFLEKLPNFFTSAVAGLSGGPP